MPGTGIESLPLHSVSQSKLQARHRFKWRGGRLYFLVEGCCCSVAQLYPTLCNPVDCSMPGLLGSHHLLEFAQVHVYCISDVIQPGHPLLPFLLLPSIFPSIRVFSNESAVRISQPKHWSFSISPSNEYSALISCKIDWCDLLAVQGTLKSLLQKKNK